MISIVLLLSVLIGALLVLYIKPSNKMVRLLLAFSGAYLLSVTVLHMLPEVYNHAHDSRIIGVLILAGILMQSILESFSKGAEHGHIHIHLNEKSFPWMLFISLCIHAFSEGLPMHTGNDSLLWAVFVHKIPIAVVLTTFLLHATTFTKNMVYVFLLIFALMSPLGHLVGSKTTFFQDHHAEITAFIIGVFLHISTVILFESTENHKFNIQKFTSILLGIALAIVTL